MKPISFLFTIVVLVCFLTKGNALRCVSSQCMNQTTTGANPTTHKSCTQSSKEITCKPMYGMPTAPDRCSILRTVTTISQGPNNMTIIAEVKNCSYSNMCGQMCNSVPKGTPCKPICCEGDLCNDGRPLPTQQPTPVTPKPTGPVGKDLTCYSCGSTEGSPTASKCDKPAKQTCGTDPLGNPQSVCMNMTAKVRSPDGKLHDMEFRNCSSTMRCNEKMSCAAMNSTGIYKECKVSCCEGNLCNGQPTGQPTTGQPTGQPTVPSDSITAMASSVLVFVLSLGIIGRF